ncbi:DUF6801 domain-containing protein [Amycolatopsis suaedae]|uniref:DUF6801 domain-containing protein n=1 Tax=Amycolatopsis suaedae TaxID=2510978 RepID=A0A4V2EME0_9PSEU|nr:DUF6801 domain-containing protein [Amycolatopsis suaedae]RZQ64735.1 hypothetical protein EWH70_07560 [Amycolatopsis suaedae]
MRRLTSIAASVALATAATGLFSATAALAATDQTYSTGNLDFTCNFPLIGETAITGNVTFDGPSSVPSGWSGQPSRLEATGVIPPDVADAIRSLAGVDGLRGSTAGDATLTNATPASVSLGLDFGEHFISGPPGIPWVIVARPAAGTVLPTITAGAPGTVTARLSGTFEVAFDVHYVNEGWQRADNVGCWLNAGQDPVFSPPMTVTSGVFG